MAQRGINKVILIGNAGADPEIRYSQNNTAIANMSIATTESWKDKQTGELQEATEWHRVVLYRRLAEIAGEYLKKGSKVYVEGRLQTRKWQDKDGIERYTTEIIATDLQMLDAPNKEGYQGASQNQSQQQPQGGYQNQSQQQQQQRQPQGGNNNQPQQQQRQPQGGYNSQSRQPAGGGYNSQSQQAPDNGFGGQNQSGFGKGNGGYN